MRASHLTMIRVHAQGIQEPYVLDLHLKLEF